MTGDAREPGVQPYTWTGLALGVVALVALSIAIYVALVLIVFIAEIPIEGWHVMSDRAAWCYQIVRGAAGYLDSPSPVDWCTNPSNATHCLRLSARQHAVAGDFVDRGRLCPGTPSRRDPLA